MLNFELFEIHVANPLSVCMYMWNPYQQTKGRQGGGIPGGALPPLHFRQLVRLEVWFLEKWRRMYNNQLIKSEKREHRFELNRIIKPVIMLIEGETVLDEMIWAMEVIP